mgnify:FL=1|jgi:hypothetical protein
MSFQSKKLRKSAKDEQCTLQIPNVCNRNRDTVVLAHINTEGGMIGGKSDDFSACFACFNCHTYLDNNRLTSEDELFYTRRAMVRTWRRWLQRNTISIEGS